ncbi:MAG: hypothetical protein ABI559_01015 [Chloroflexota bacterium]
MPALVTPASAQAVSDRIRQATERLSTEFAPQIEPQVVEQVANEWLAPYKTAPVVEFLPLLVERFTRERLLARLQGQAQA